MNLPKQSTPVTRSLASVKYSSQFGVNPSLGRTEFNRLFNLSGTCSCYLDPNAGFFGGKGAFRPLFRLRGCNPGFAPQCTSSGGCTCVNTSGGDPPRGGTVFL
jgi:hypothetical protein